MNLLAHPELLDRLAAAYALGTLRGGARRRFEAMARQSPGIRTAALLWQERFASMTELQPGQVPSPNVWKRIENLLDANTAPAAAKEAPMLQTLRARLGLWRGAALAAGVGALAVAAFSASLGLRLQERDAQIAQLQAKPEIEYVAVLSDDRAAASMLVTFDPKHNTLTLKRVAGIDVGPDQSLQLWALPPGGGPRSLGVLGSDPVVRLAAAEDQVREVPALAISLEPRGGAPAGSGPTGPVLFKGALLQTPL